MPKIVIEADTREETLEMLIDLGIAQLNLRQMQQQQVAQQPKQEQVPQGGTEKTPTYKARFANKGSEDDQK
jgi:hypothetical protein